MENNSVFGPNVQLGSSPAKASGEPVATEIVPAIPAGTSLPALPSKQASLAEIMSSQFNVKLTDQQQANLAKFGAEISETNISQIPLMCAGTDCPFLKNCPLFQNGVSLPTNKQCPVEQVAIRNWKQKFYDASGVGEGHPQRELIYSLIDELVGHAIMQTRVFWQASQNGKAVKEECIGVNADGEPIYTTRLDPSLDYLLRIGDKKVRILRELIATPRSQVESKKFTSSDPSTLSVKLLNELAKLAGTKKIEGPHIKIDL